MLMPSIFGENLFDDFMDDFAFPDIDKKLYGKHAPHIMKTDVKEKDNAYDCLLYTSLLLYNIFSLTYVITSHFIILEAAFQILPQVTGHLALAAVAKWTCQHVRLARCSRI